jgi:hypothetical protein
MISMCSNPPKDIMPRHIEGPQGYATGGPNGPAAVIQDTRGWATWKYAVSQNPAALDQIFCRTPYLNAFSARIRLFWGDSIATSPCPERYWLAAVWPRRRFFGRWRGYVRGIS